MPPTPTWIAASPRPAPHSTMAAGRTCHPRRASALSTRSRTSSRRMPLNLPNSRPSTTANPSVLRKSSTFPVRWTICATWRAWPRSSVAGWSLRPRCTLVHKPAEQTSVTPLRLADLVAEAGFPPGVINVVTGNGHTAGDRLVKHPDVDKVAFTGSHEGGKITNRNATETLKRVTLELGGKSPVIVMPDVNVDEVAAAAAGGVFFNAGQICVAGPRLFAHRSIFDRMVEGVSKASAFWKPRPSLDPEAHMGPLISK